MSTHRSPILPATSVTRRPGRKQAALRSALHAGSEKLQAAAVPFGDNQKSVDDHGALVFASIRVDADIAGGPILTPQEIVCLEWCKEGKTNWEIGEILLISEKTVEFHLGNVMKKLGATNRITAVVLGLRYRLISL